MLSRPSLLALAAFLAVLGWQALTVRANYSGNWTGLFRTGANAPVPSALLPSTLRNAHPVGYDGQFYRILAHDPLLRHGAAAFLDAPALRAGRILIPALAYAIAAGQPAWIDAAYILLIDASIAAGVFLLALLFLHYGRPAPFGLLFLLLPPALSPSIR